MSWGTGSSHNGRRRSGIQIWWHFAKFYQVPQNAQLSCWKYTFAIIIYNVLTACWLKKLFQVAIMFLCVHTHYHKWLHCPFGPFKKPIFESKWGDASPPIPPRGYATGCRSMISAKLHLANIVAKYANVASKFSSAVHLWFSGNTQRHSWLRKGHVQTGTS